MENRDIIKALEYFRDAYLNLLGAWQDNDILNDLDSVKLYPFENSFDELDVCTWVEESIDELHNL